MGLMAGVTVANKLVLRAHTFSAALGLGGAKSSSSFAAEVVHDASCVAEVRSLTFRGPDPAHEIFAR